MKAIVKFQILFFIILIIFGCSSHKFTLAPIKTFDPDNKNIPAPKDIKENQIWDIADMTVFYQIEKVLDLNWSARKIGKGLNLVKGRSADNVNALDEVPNSSWYTNRHYQNRMNLEDLQNGPNVTAGPDQSGLWLIWLAKTEGGTPGLFIRDAKGDAYILKFDAPQFQEMGSSAEVISTKFFHAAGYHVPQNTIEYFDPDILQVQEGVMIPVQGSERQMTTRDVEDLLRPIPRREDGKIRCLASKLVDGKVVGVWNYIGTRSDDPNDLVHHEHRRELRGLRTFASWLSDEDRRAANTLAVYTEDKETGNKYIKHFIIDMGSTMGSNNIIPHAPKYGSEYLVDPRTIALQFITFGLYVKPWEFEIEPLEFIGRKEDPNFPYFHSIGYYESEIFDPGDWYPTYPNPAFEYATYRDAFWGAKIVMSFTDEDIRAIVKTANYSNPKAEEYLIKTLIERRDKVGRYWFERMNPLDKFKFKQSNDVLTLTFNDLAVDGHLASAKDTKYIYTLSYNKKGLHKQEFVHAPKIPISANGAGFLDQILATNDIKNEEDKIFLIKIQTVRKGKKPSRAVDVYFYYPGQNKEARVVGILREE